jgi:hypothetical protein
MGTYVSTLHGKVELLCTVIAAWDAPKTEANLIEFFKNYLGQTSDHVPQVEVGGTSFFGISGRW